MTTSGMLLKPYKKLDIPVCGFRAPYDVYTEASPRLLEKHGFLWDIGIGYKPKYGRAILCSESR